MPNRTQLVHKFHDSTTSIGVGNELAIQPEMSIVNIDLSGTGTGVNINFEAKIDNNSDWRLVRGANLTTMILASSVTTLGSVYQFDLSGFFKFRVNITTLTSGNVVATGRVVN